MRRIVIPILLSLALMSPAGLAVAELIHQELEVTLDPAARRLSVRASISPAGETGFWPEAYQLAKHADIESVTVDGRAVPFEFTGGRLQVPMRPGASTLTMEYSARFDDPVPRDTVGIEDPSYGVAATILPQGAYLSESSGWHPRVDGMKSLFRVRIAGPRTLVGVTAGRLLDYQTSDSAAVTTWQVDVAQASLALAAGDYHLQRDDLGEIQLLVFVTEQNIPLAPGYLQAVRDDLSLYQQLFGPYPYAKFAVVENFYPTGYGLPGWTLLGSSVIRLPFILTTSLPHEIAHAWWGNAVEIDYASGNWGEGLATYVADYYLKEIKDPGEAREYRRKLLRDYASLVAGQDPLPLTAFRGRMSKRDQAIGYGKSAMVFHMLRNLIGDEAFWAGLKAVAEQGFGRTYAWSDLERHFAAAADMDLRPFFRQWLQRTGAPQLSLADVDLLKVEGGWQVSGSLGQGEPLYDLAVPLQLETSSRVYEQVVGLNVAQDCFVFTVADRPVSLSVDPDSHLFRALTTEEIPATINDLRASRTPLVVVAKGADALLESSRDLLRGLQWHQVDVVDEATLLAAPPAGRDLLFLGWPDNETLQTAPPAGQAGAALQFSSQGKPELADGEVVFLVSEWNQGDQVAAYFLPGSSAAAEDTARRIPHYGRYSYLLFRDGSNQFKATREPGASPLKVFFNEDMAR